MFQQAAAFNQNIASGNIASVGSMFEHVRRRNGAEPKHWQMERVACHLFE
jgi:hypothetical protein